MTVSHIQFHSDNLGKQVTYSAILPDVGDPPFPALIQLHGLSDDHNAWVQNSRLVRHVSAYPLVVLMPDGGTSMYLNWRGLDRVSKLRYESMIIDDLTAHAKRFLPVTDGPWAIGGLSMGGFGAMRLGLKYAGRFASIWSHSSKLYWENIDQTDLLEDYPDALIEPHAERAARLERPPVVGFDCGVDDELIGENRRFHAFLQGIRMEHHYAEHPGAHDWAYWDTHVQEALAQHARVLGLHEV